MTNNRLLLLCIAGALAACNNTPATDAGMTPGTDGGHDAGGSTADTGIDGGGTPNDAGNDAAVVTMTDSGIANTCAGYCTYEIATCTGANAQYIDMADCMAQCTDLAWPDGTVGATSGNTLACRIYHSTVAAGSAAMATAHCIHTGSTGGGVCGTVAFRTDAATEVDPTLDPPPAGYRRVDRMGMPAVSTALVASADKNTYNDGTPADDASLVYAGGMLGVLGGLHAALDDDLATAHLAPCSMTASNNLGFTVAVPDCVAQTYGAGRPVVSLVVPDTLTIDPTAAAGFPNGRQLDDHVIDVTLAVLLLDLGDTNTHPRTPMGGSPGMTPRAAGTCGTGTTAGPCTAATFVSLPAGGLAQHANDSTASTTFPYLAAPHP